MFWKCCIVLFYDCLSTTSILELLQLYSISTKIKAYASENESDYYTARLMRNK